MALYLITYASIAIFCMAVILRFIHIQKQPLNLRWEIYPVPHEGKRAKYGGSRMEEVDWWTKEHKPSLITELIYMIQEMVFIKALYENNRKLWYRSFPFHFGLYICSGFIGLLILGSIVILAGGTVGPEGGALGSLVHVITVTVGIAGVTLALIGSIGLLHMRLTDIDLKPYTNRSHIFNLLLFVIVMILHLVLIFTYKDYFLTLRGYIVSLITFNISFGINNTLLSVAVLFSVLLLAYIPLTHMSHFFIKWFTWHKIRWDDEPNVKGGRIDRMIQKALQYPVSWSAEHIGADGKKTWADIAAEEVHESEVEDKK